MEMALKEDAEVGGRVEGVAAEAAVALKTFELMGSRVSCSRHFAFDSAFKSSEFM